MRQFLASEAELYQALEYKMRDANICGDLIARAAELAGRWSELATVEKRALLAAVVDRVDLMPETLEIRIRPARLFSVLNDENNNQEPMNTESDDLAGVTLTVPARLKRTGIETRLLIDGASSSARRAPDHSLHRVLAQAHQYNAMVMRSGGRTMAELAAEAGVGGSYFTRILRLSYLAPEITKDILRDRHPIGLNAKRLVNQTNLPIGWEQQRSLIYSD